MLRTKLGKMKGGEINRVLLYIKINARLNFKLTLNMYESVFSLENPVHILGLDLM